MRLSVVFELLLIFLIIAFSAARVIESPTKNALTSKTSKALKERQEPLNRYCACTTLQCNCCREFSLPVVPVKGPGCASIRYLNGDSMSISMSFGDRVLRSVTISGKKPKPVCMSLPGGISKFCGRVYGISREEDQFKACLGLELRALDDVEAALRVSCFRFGPQGLNVEPGQPLPSSAEDEDDDDYGLTEDDDDDDDDDEEKDEETDDDDGGSIVDFGLTGGDDEEEDDDDDAEDDNENDVDSGDTDYTGFSALGDDFFESIFGSSPDKKKKKPAIVNDKPLVSAVPLSPSLTTIAPVKNDFVPPSPSSQKTSDPISATEKLATLSSLASVVTAGDFQKQSSDSPDVEAVTSSTMSVSVVQNSFKKDGISSNKVSDAENEVSTQYDPDGDTSASDKVEKITQAIKVGENAATPGSVDKNDDEEDEEEEDGVEAVVESAVDALNPEADEEEKESDEEEAEEDAEEDETEDEKNEETEENTSSSTASIKKKNDDDDGDLIDDILGASTADDDEQDEDEKNKKKAEKEKKITEQEKTNAKQKQIPQPQTLAKPKPYTLAQIHAQLTAAQHQSQAVPQIPPQPVPSMIYRSSRVHRRMRLPPLEEMKT